MPSNQMIGMCVAGVTGLTALLNGVEDPMMVGAAALAASLLVMVVDAVKGNSQSSSLDFPRFESVVQQQNNYVPPARKFAPSSVPSSTRLASGIPMPAMSPRRPISAMNYARVPRKEARTVNEAVAMPNHGNNETSTNTEEKVNPLQIMWSGVKDLRQRFTKLEAAKNGGETMLPPGQKIRVAVVGGGPSGACAAEIFANEPNIETYMFERKMDNCKPCGGAIPLCMVEEFDLPEEIIDRKVRRMTMISPSNVEIDIGQTLKENEYIGMTRREVLDKYLRDRAVERGCSAINGLVTQVDLPKSEGGRYKIHYADYGDKIQNGKVAGTSETLDVDIIIGADGANSRVAKAVDAGEYNFAIAFQERIKIPDDKMKRYEDLAEMYVGDDVSPDFYGWVFPKYDHVGVGTGTVINRPAIKEYQKAIRDRAGEKIAGGKIIKVEAHPIPEHMRPRRVVGRVALVGDAAGYVTKCSGEGIYFAAKSGRMAAEAIVKLMRGGSRLPTEKEIKQTYLRDYDRAYGPTYKVLDILQRVFYTNNAAREAFVEMCDSPYVQQVTFDSYLYKKVQGNNPVEDIKLLFGTIGSLIRGNAMSSPDKQFSNPIESQKRL